MWQSVTTPGFAAVFRGNTHTQPNHRLPITAATHAEECKREQCLIEAKSLKTICKIAQRTQRNATGYYCGYTFKAQVAGKKELSASAESLNYMRTGLEDKTVGQQWHRVSHRVMQDMQHRCMLRTAAEEFNLSANSDDHDVKNAEFLRTYMSEDFPGGQLVKRLENEKKSQQTWTRSKVLPVQKNVPGTKPIMVTHFEDAYGFRGSDPRVYFLNAWEFFMYWRVEKLKPPSDRPRETDLTMWLPDVPHFDEDGKSHPGKQYVVRRVEDPDVVLLPEGGATAELRHQFYFSRRKRPVVPAPVNTPMPDKQGTKEKKSRLFCVYMRPWVLDRRFASPLVPHLCDLDVVPNTSSAVPAAANFVGALHSSNESTPSTARSSCKRRRITGKTPENSEQARSFQNAWSWYLRHIVSHHQQRLIVQFMAACPGKSQNNDDPEEQNADDAEHKGENPQTSLPLQNVHGVLDRMSAPPACKETANTKDRDDAEKIDDVLLRQSVQIKQAVRITAEMWGRENLQ